MVDGWHGYDKDHRHLAEKFVDLRFTVFAFRVSSPDNHALGINQYCGRNASDTEFLGSRAFETCVITLAGPQVANMGPTLSLDIWVHNVLRIVYADRKYVNARIPVAMTSLYYLIELCHRGFARTAPRGPKFQVDNMSLQTTQ